MAQGLPSTYDLRAVQTNGGIYSFVPTIQNQASTETCWTFASATAINSGLLKSGILPAATTPPSLIISSWDLATHNGAAEPLNPPYDNLKGFGGWGGWIFETLGYLSRGQGAWQIPNTVPRDTNYTTLAGGGPVLDGAQVTPSNVFNTNFWRQSNISQNGPNISFLIPPANQTPAYFVTNMVFLDQGVGNNYPINSTNTNGANDNQVSLVKKAISDFGAVTTCMDANYNWFYSVSPTNSQIFITNNTPTTTDLVYLNPGDSNTDHVVTIIGWNDNYKIYSPTDTNNFQTGAWLVQNSWGTKGSTFGPNAYGTNFGTFWVSYNDPNIGRVGVSAFQTTTPNTYNPKFIQNEIGPMSYAYQFYTSANNNPDLGVGSLGMDQLISSNVASVLTANQKGLLSAIGIATYMTNTSVVISVYANSNWSTSPNTGPSGTLLNIQTNTLNGIGYTLLNLNMPTYVTNGQKITVQLDYGMNNAAAVVVGNNDLAPGSTNFSVVPNGLSYFSSNGVWTDLSTLKFTSYNSNWPTIHGGILFLKGVTTGPYVSPYAITLTNDISSWCSDIAYRNAVMYSNTTPAMSNWYTVPASEYNNGLTWGPLMPQLFSSSNGNALIDGRGNPVYNVAINSVPSGVDQKTYSQERLLYVADSLIGTIYQHTHLPEFDQNLVTNGSYHWNAVTTNTTVFTSKFIDTGVVNPYLASYGVPTPGIDCTDFTALIYNLALGVQLGSGVGNQIQFSSGTNPTTSNYPISTIIANDGKTFVQAKFITNSNYGQSLPNTPSTMSNVIAQLQPGDLLYMSGEGGSIAHVVVWLGIYGTYTNGSVVTDVPLVISSHDNTPAVFDTINVDSNGIPIPTNGQTIAQAVDAHLSPPGVQILPFVPGNWFYDNFSVAMDVISYAPGAPLTITGLYTNGGTSSIYQGVNFSNNSELIIPTNNTMTVITNVIVNNSSTLLVNGTFTTSNTNGKTTIASGSTLSGSGTLTGGVLSSGVIRPTGNLTLGSLTWSAGTIALTPKLQSLTVVNGLTNSGGGGFDFENISLDNTTNVLISFGNQTGFSLSDFHVNGFSGISFALSATSVSEYISPNANLVVSTNISINNSLSVGNLTLTPSGSLNGMGTLKGNLINGGFVSPGDHTNPTGSITVTGNYVQSSSGSLLIQVGDGSNGMVVVNGSATLGGTLVINPYGGHLFQYGDAITFLSASSITGSFATVEVPAGFRPRVKIVGDPQLEVIMAPLSYSQLALTQNQTNVARALDSFIPATNGDKITVSSALDNLTAGQYQAAFTAIMPTIYQSLSTVAFNLANALNQELLQRLWGVRVAGTGFSMRGLAENAPVMEAGGDKGVLDSKKDILRSGEDNHWGMFLDCNGIFAKASSGNMLPTYNSQSGGAITGLTYKWNNSFGTGIFTGYEGSYNKYAANSGYGNGSTVIDNALLFGVFGTYGKSDAKGFHADGLVGGGYNNYNVSRAIAFSGVNRTATSSPGAAELDAMLAAGYDFKNGNWTYGPTTSLQYTYFSALAVNEHGAQALDFSSGGWQTSSLLYSLGGHAAYTWRANRDITVVPQINLSWQHEFLQNPYDINGSLGGSPSFSTTSNASLRDSLYTGVGVTLEYMNKWNSSLFYNASAGNNNLTSQNFFWSAGVTF